MIGRRQRQTGAAALATALALGVTLASVAGGPAAAAQAQDRTGRGDHTALGPRQHDDFDHTSPVEATRVDRVATPSPTWTDCSAQFSPGSQCALVELPLDYDEPGGATTSVAVLRVPATDPARRIGTLFVNPGGPGGSGVQIASRAAAWAPAEVRARFDIVGLDPRGTNNSDRVECFTDAEQQAEVEAALESGDMFSPEGIAATVDAATAFGTACSSTSNELAGSMSTAEVARDMDVLRRMVGDEKLTYLGFSYGSYLGTVYADMFPDRVRAIVIDGVLDPIAWSGIGDDNADRGAPLEARLRSGDGTHRAVTELLSRCGSAGPEYCGLAGLGDPTELYDELLTRLESAPPVLDDPSLGGSVTLTRSLFQGVLGSAVYDADGAEYLDSFIAAVWTLTEPPGDEGSAEAAAQAEARAFLIATLAELMSSETTGPTPEQERAAFGQPPARNNYLEAGVTVVCTDGVHPRDAARWPDYAAATDATSGGFGRSWAWIDAPCATQTWTVSDEDAYPGPFTHRTSAPVLVVGNYWDPATRYEGAVATSQLLPSSRLLSSDSWGHTAMGTSTCVDDAITAYLGSGSLPAQDTVCTGDYQPFTTPREELPPDDAADDAGADPVVDPLIEPEIVPTAPDELREPAASAQAGPATS